jgi:hypothetical protein
MPVPHAFSAQERPESKILVVAISALQLALVVLVWLLALVPVAAMALVAAVFQALKSAAAKVPTPTAAGS